MTPRLRSVALATLVFLFASAAPVLAQTVSLTPEPPSGARGLLPRFRFYLSAATLLTDDERFDWDADFGGDIDLVDYGVGRVTALANFETVLGDQLRDFDPNQGNYTLDVSASLRSKRLEAALVFHHISRHLSDRPKPFPIDWNMVGLRVAYEISRPGTRIQIDGRLLDTVTRSFVDYRAEIGGSVSLRRELNPRVSLIASGDGYGMFVETASLRGHQNGGRLEAGLRVSGSKGAVELFAGYERRIDADPFEQRPRTWMFAGFRLLSAN